MRIDDVAQEGKDKEIKDLRKSALFINATLPGKSAFPEAIPYRIRTAAPNLPKPVRITYAPGTDILPVFSPDYKKLMWTSTRDGRQPAQLWIADFTPPKDE
jgi:Tol biopolymer transport system component